MKAELMGKVLGTDMSCLLPSRSKAGDISASEDVQPRMHSIIGEYRPRECTRSVGYKMRSGKPAWQRTSKLGRGHMRSVSAL